MSLGQIAAKLGSQISATGSHIATAWNNFSNRAAAQLGPDLPPVSIKESMGSIWISNTYRLGRLMDFARLYYKFTRRERLFRQKLQKQIDDSFDDIQFPGLRQIIPCFKEGGCYVTFASKDQAKSVINEIAHQVNVAGHIKKAYLVQGRPFIEDLTHRLPSTKIVLELHEPAKTQQRLNLEMLFHEMRPFGKIQDIILDPKKEFASIIFNSTNSAIAARNCLHFKTIGDSKFIIRYEPYSRFQFIWDAFHNAKIMIPLVTAGVSGSIYALVDPTRFASVTQHLARGYEKPIDTPSGIKDSSLLAFHNDLVTEWRNLFRTRPKEAIVMISGPPGAGKTELLKQALSGRRNTFVVDCKNVSSVQEFVDVFGTSIGFSPSFNTLNTLTVWLEYFLPGLSKRTSLTPSIKTQLESMLGVLGQAITVNNLAHIAEHADYPVIVLDGFPDFLQNIEIQPGGAFVLANAAPAQLTQAREEREKAELALNLLLEWVHRHSAEAHFVIIGDNPFGEEKIENCEALRRATILKYSVSDLSLDQTASFVKNNLPQISVSPEDLTTAHLHFGGRLTDIGAFLSKLRSNLPVEVALKEMIEQNEQMIRKDGFNGKFLSTTPINKPWNQVQLWKAIKMVANQPNGVAYDDILFSAFSGDNEALAALVRENILFVEMKEGAKKVRAPSPMFQSTFHKMVYLSPKLRRGMDIVEKKADINKDLDEMTKLEEELIRLKDAQSKIDAESLKTVTFRRKLLDEKMEAIVKRLEKKERELRELESS